MQGEEEQARVWRAADEKSVGGAYRHTATLLWPGYTPRLQKSRPEAEPHPPPAGPLLVGRPDSKLSLKKKKKKTGGAGEERPGTTAARVSVPGAAHPAPKLPPRPAQPASQSPPSEPQLQRAPLAPGRRAKDRPPREPLIGSVESRAAGSDQLRDGSRGLCCWRHVVRREKSCPPLRLPVSPLPRTQTCSKKKKASSIITR